MSGFSSVEVEEIGETSIEYWSEESLLWFPERNEENTGWIPLEASRVGLVEWTTLNFTSD
jgi:hypothetical protein